LKNFLTNISLNPYYLVKKKKTLSLFHFTNDKSKEERMIKPIVPVSRWKYWNSNSGRSLLTIILYFLSNINCNFRNNQNTFQDLSLPELVNIFIPFGSNTMCQSAVCHCDKLPKVINLKGGLMDVVYGTSHIAYSMMCIMAGTH
jgi:hypothetical protein